MLFFEEVGLGNAKRAYRFTYDFDKHEILNSTSASYADHEDTYIINAFDRYEGVGVVEICRGYHVYHAGGVRHACLSPYCSSE